MFAASNAKSLNLSSFDTSNITNMNHMFSYSKATTLDLSNFNTSKVTDMRNMFMYSAATIGYAKDTDSATRFNTYSVTKIPSTLKFTVK